MRSRAPVLVVSLACCLLLAAASKTSPAATKKSHKTRRGGTNPSAFKLASWMSDINEHIGAKALKDIWIPGECAQSSQ